MSKELRANYREAIRPCLTQMIEHLYAENDRRIMDSLMTDTKKVICQIAREKEGTNVQAARLLGMSRDTLKTFLNK